MPTADLSELHQKPIFPLPQVHEASKPDEPQAISEPSKIYWPRRALAVGPDRPFSAWLKNEMMRPDAGSAGPAAPRSTPASKPSVARPLDRHGELWRTVEAVNRAVNRSIRSRSDRDQFGREDVWQTSAEGPVTAGDCEDFVIEKRHRLLAAGLNGTQLSIALVETARGQAHAVLLIATDEGEYVLDSLTPWIVPWDKVGYRWISRQGQGTPLRWVSLAQ